MWIRRLWNDFSERMTVKADTYGLAMVTVTYIRFGSTWLYLNRSTTTRLNLLVTEKSLVFLLDCDQEKGTTTLQCNEQNVF